MMKIPDFMNRDDYLQNPIMRRFLTKVSKNSPSSTGGR